MAKPRSDEQPVTSAAGSIPGRCTTARSEDCAPHFLLLRAYNYWAFPKGEL